MDLELDTIGRRLRYAREKRGLTQQKLADALSISKNAVSQWERDENAPATGNLIRVAEVLKFNVRWLADRVGEESSGEAPEGTQAINPPSSGKLPPRQPLPPPNASAPVKVKSDGPGMTPVLGLGRGGDDGSFRFNGETIQYVPRPAELEDVDGGYGIYVAGESMFPRYKEGELVFAHPRPPKRGEDVVVQLYPDQEGDPPEGYVKEFRAWTPRKLVLWQWNPASEIEIDRALVKSIHVIVGRR